MIGCDLVIEEDLKEGGGGVEYNAIASLARSGGFRSFCFCLIVVARCE